MMNSLCRAAEGKFKVRSLLGGGRGGRSVVCCGDYATKWAFENTARSKLGESSIVGVLQIYAHRVAQANSRNSFFSGSSSRSVSFNPGSLPKSLALTPPPCAECACKGVSRTRGDCDHGDLVSGLLPLTRCPLSISTVESCEQHKFLPGGVSGATCLPPNLAESLDGLHKPLVQCRSQQNRLQLLRESTGSISSDIGGYSSQKPSAESLTGTSSHSFFCRSVGQLKTRSRHRDSQRDSAGRFPFLALAFATTLVFPVKEEREFAAGSKGFIDKGRKSPATWAACHQRPEYISICSELALPFSLGLLLRAEAVVRRAAQAVYDRVRFIESLVAHGATSEVAGSWGWMSGCLRQTWDELQQFAALSATAPTERRMLSQLSEKTLSDWRHEGDCQVKKATEMPPAETILQGPICQGLSLVSNVAATEKVETAPAKAGAVGREPVRQLTAQAVSQTARRQIQETDPSGADPQHLLQQPDKVGREQSDAPLKSASWFAEHSRELGVFFRIFISVCQRLLFVVPLAFAAVTAGFWLVMVPYISAGLLLVGLDKNLVIRWDAAAQYELREVMFTAITAAASAAGPTYVKFLQLDMCAVDRNSTRPFPRIALLSMCKVRGTWHFAPPSFLAVLPTFHATVRLLFMLATCIKCLLCAAGFPCCAWRLQTAVRPFSYPRAAFLLREQFGEDVAKYLILDPSYVLSGCGCESGRSKMPPKLAENAHQCKGSQGQLPELIAVHEPFYDARFCCRPVGCGCIAQVYRAYLLLSGDKNSDSRRRFLQHAFVLGEDESTPIAISAQTGEGSIPVAVAVKIMRPGVRESMEFDLRMMLLLASAVQWLRAFGFVAIKKRSFDRFSVEEFGVAMRRQLDFGLEEKHIKKFRANFGLPSPPVPEDLLPLHNKFRRLSQATSPDVSSREVNAQRQHGSILAMLPLKSFGMRRQVAFPYPFEALNSSEVLVMTLEGGFTLNQLFKVQKGLQEADHRTPEMGGSRGSRALAQAAKRSQASSDPAKLPRAVAESLIQRFSNIGMICLHSFLQMVFLDNFFHGDMHSGNLLCRYARDSPELIFPVVPTTSVIHPSPRREGQLELVVLDCGLAGSLSQADRINFVTLLEAIGMKRGRDAAIAMLRRARRSACKDEAKFCSEVEKLINEHHFEEGNSMQMKRVGFTSLMGRMLSLSKEYSVELDPSFVSLVVAMSILEGVGAQLCPDTDVLKAAMPYSFVAAKLLRLALSRDG